MASRLVKLNNYTKNYMEDNSYALNSIASL